MSLWHRWKRLISDPPPDFVFELSEAGVAWAGTAPPAPPAFAPLEPGVIEVSPLRDNVQRPAELEHLLARILPPGGKRAKRRRAVLVLPDFSARVMVLDFDSFPANHEEQHSLVRFRIKKSVPFDLDSAVVRYFVQPGKDSRKVFVVAAVTAMEIISRYEAPFRTAGLHPGHVTISALAALDLLRDSGFNTTVRVMAKLSGRCLSLSVLEGGTLRLFRCVQLGSAGREEVLEMLFPTFAYAEDVLGKRPEQLFVCGFGRMDAAAQESWRRDLGIPVASVRCAAGKPGPFDAGLRGCLEALRP